MAFAAAILLIRSTVADAWPITAWLVYFVPLPLVSVSLLLAAIAFAATKAPRIAITTLTVAASIYGTWHVTTHFEHECKSTDGNLRILSWNVARGRVGDWPSIAAYAARSEADIIGLVEAGHSNADQQEFWNAYFPGYQATLPGGGLVLLVRGTIESSRFRQLIGVSNVLTASVAVDGRNVEIVLVDLDASPRFDKGRLNAAILALAHEEADAPVVVLGDFNTPIGSRWFRGFRESLSHAFESAGSGRLATWPDPWPFLALDHIWVSRSLAPTCTRLITTGLSDHLAIHADVEFRARP